MRYFDMLNIGLHQIQIFLAVAKTENLTVSSEYLHISQSTLSKTIAMLERETGLLLFSRQKGKLKLTPAGKILSDEFSMLSVLIEKALEKAHLEQERQENPIRFGISDCIDPDKYFLRSVKHYQSQVENFYYHSECYPMHDLPIKLVHEELDVIFTALFNEPVVKGLNLDYAVLCTFPLTAYVREDSPIAQKDEVLIDDLKQMKFILRSPILVPNYYNNVIAPMCEKYNFTPKVAYYFASSGTVSLNETSINDVFVTDCCRKIESYYNNLKQLPIKDTVSGIIMAWRDNENTAIKSFIETTKDYWSHNTID